MSGGVDSSVAAALLAEQGHDVIGVSMQLYDQSEGQRRLRRTAPAARSTTSRCAARGAAAIGIPHYILNFERRFDEQVVANFVREYAAGARRSRARTATAT
jgi:tRNA-uridine 2-sulfurtransferase